jgi:hypothetical protein
VEDRPVHLRLGRFIEHLRRLALGKDSDRAAAAGPLAS